MENRAPTGDGPTSPSPGAFLDPAGHGLVHNKECKPDPETYPEHWADDWLEEHDDALQALVEGRRA